MKELENKRKDFLECLISFYQKISEIKKYGAELLGALPLVNHPKSKLLIKNRFNENLRVLEMAEIEYLELKPRIIYVCALNRKELESDLSKEMRRVMKSIERELAN